MRCLSRKTTLATLAAALFAGAPAQAAPAWITIGEQAQALLQRIAPADALRVLSSASVPSVRPTDASGRSLVRGSETVSAIEIDDELLPQLSIAVHEELKRCGGFAQHRSMAEALAVLHRLQNPTEPQAVPSYAIDNVALVNGLLPQLQESNLLSTIQSLSDFQNRRYNSNVGGLASNWLFTRWSQLNPGTRRDVSVRQITHTGWSQKSVEFTIIGSGNSGETIVLGAHLDSIASGGSVETQRAPGADDDASGVAALTEIIRVMMTNGYMPKRNLRFIAYSAEEVGLRGSADIAGQQVARRDQVVGALQLDMTAFQGSPGKDIWIYTDYTNAGQNQFLANLAAAYLPTLNVNYDACGYACSDHASWTTRGFIASFPHEASNTQYNMAIHSANDTLATFGNQATHAIKFTRLALAYALELASDGPAPKGSVAAR